MTTAAARIATLAAGLASASGLTVYAEPGVPGRGDVFAFIDAPTFTYEPTASAFCLGGRPVRLRASVVIVAAGVAPGQAAALIDAAEAMVGAIDALGSWIPAGDAVPAVFDDRVPAYSIPIRST